MNITISKRGKWSIIGVATLVAGIWLCSITGTGEPHIVTAPQLVFGTLAAFGGLLALIMAVMHIADDLSC